LSGLIAFREFDEAREAETGEKTHWLHTIVAPFFTNGFGGTTFIDLILGTTRCAKSTPIPPRA
jgi:hypothetical protein